MVAHAALSVPPPRAGAPARPSEPPPGPVVAVEAGHAGEAFYGIAAALLDERVWLDTSAASRAQLNQLRRFLPPERLVGDEHHQHCQSATSLLARCFRCQADDQDALHARLRRRVTEARPCSHPALPAVQGDDLVALVLVRRDHTRCSSAMNAHNLDRVLAALSALDQRAQRPQQRIAHALLYGDLRPDELGGLARAVTGPMTVSVLPGRFLERARPGEVPGVLSHFAALYERYRDRLFAVGFRSITIDAAALLGIPSFYFCETPAAQATGDPGDGRYLIDARCDQGTHDRRLSQDINTLVRIDTRSGRAHVDERALADLMTAIRVWTPRSLSGARRTWSERTRLCRSGLLRLQFDSVRAQCLADARYIEHRSATGTEARPGIR
jgi:hypothetical protein